MGRYLLIGAGFTRNWNGPLSDEITGSLLGELHDDPIIAQALRKGPFEDAFQGFHAAARSETDAKRLTRFQGAVTALFGRLNKTLLTKDFEFSNDIQYSVKRFLAQFDAIFSLNQDLLLEVHYKQTFVSVGKWNGVVVPNMRGVPPVGTLGPVDLTMWKWQPEAALSAPPTGFQPLYKLHGSSNWQTSDGTPLLIMGNAKSGAINAIPVIKSYHEKFAESLNQSDSKLMIIGYSFQDEHINSVIQQASERSGLGTHLVDPQGREVLKDPKMKSATIKVPRDIENIRIIGELRRPISSVFGGDAFAHGELMRFFS